MLTRSHILHQSHLAYLESKLTPYLPASTIPRSKFSIIKTGRFLVVSTYIHSYKLVLHDYNSNYMHSENMLTMNSKYILAAYQWSIAILIKAGLWPKLQRLDNEFSQILQNFMYTQEVDFHLVSIHFHHHNTAECVISTFKENLINVLYSTNETFHSTSGKFFCHNVASG